MALPQTLQEPIKILVAALGGEGGGVLASWLQAAAIADGHFIQGTSVPGVAQRTGATTYYMEIVPGGGSRHASTHAPVLALNAAPGEVDLLVASELLEAVRAVGTGFVTPDRTTLIASTARVYTVDEKAAMGDGRLDPAKLEEVARQFARSARIAAFGAEAARLGCPISPLLLGAIAGAGVLPMAPEVYRAAIRREGKAVESNLRGFEAGLQLATRAGNAQNTPVTQPADASPAAGAALPPPPMDLPATLAALPAPVRSVIAHGVHRLTDYQDDAYARDYLATLARLAQHPRADAVFVEELARQLALRMSVEDVIRVAQLKLRESRLARVRAESKAAPGEIVDITEYLKPGPEEICGVLPARLGAWLLKRLPRDKAWAMTVRTTRPSGYLRLKLLAALKRWRPGSLRAQEEARWRTEWLALIERTLAHDTRAAQEVAALAGLVRGYGSTYARGQQNYAAIVAALRPGDVPAPLLADALLQARLAASKDPEGQTLARVIASVRETVQQHRAAAE